MNYNSYTAGAKIDQSLYRLFDKKLSEWSFSNDDVPAEIILEIFDTARTMTGSYDYKEQAWIGLMANRKDEKFGQILNCLDEFNKISVELAPCLGAISEKRQYNKKGGEKKSNFYNTEVFIETAIQKAASLEYRLQLMFGFSSKMIKENFDITEGYEPKIVFAIGKNKFKNNLTNKDGLPQQIDKYIKQNN